MCDWLVTVKVRGNLVVSVKQTEEKMENTRQNTNKNNNDKNNKNNNNSK